jgi:hypothetical protein
MHIPCTRWGHKRTSGAIDGHGAPFCSGLNNAIWLSKVAYAFGIICFLYPAFICFHVAGRVSLPRLKLISGLLETAVTSFAEIRLICQAPVVVAVVLLCCCAVGFAGGNGRCYGQTQEQCDTVDFGPSLLFSVSCMSHVLVSDPSAHIGVPLHMIKITWRLDFEAGKLGQLNPGVYPAFLIV